MSALGPIRITINQIVGLFILALLLAGNAAFGAEKEDAPTIVVASFSFPPLLHESQTGEFSGSMGETVKELCAAANLKCRFLLAPLKRAYLKLREGDVDALITINVNQLNDCCHPSQWHSPWSAGFFSSIGKEANP